VTCGDLYLDVAIALALIGFGVIVVMVWKL
jgi:hypothetical protein